MQIEVELRNRSYAIEIASGALARVGDVVSTLAPSRVLVVTNTTVGPLYADRVLESMRHALPSVPCAVFALPEGEAHKDMAHLETILDAAAEHGLDRRSVFVALGGGVVGDMAGMAASLWMRGARCVQVPTTLLAQVDSSVGGKTGVNLKSGKNLAGAFFQPKAVVIDPDVLQSLPAREVSAGLGEIVKYGFLGDAEFVETLEATMPRLRALDATALESVIAHCCRMKAEIVRCDEQECGVRALLNLGHTFAHAIERLAGFGTWLHGEAVGMGLVLAVELSRKLGYISARDVERVRALVAATGVPTQVQGLSIEEAVAAMRGDKKAISGTLRFVVMTAIGKSRTETVDEGVVCEVLADAGWRA